MRFQQETVANVEAMFLQVRGNKDTDLFGFLWWPDGNYEQELVEHKMLVHFFGATSSLSVATFALQKCATDFEDDFGQEATVKKKNHVEDCLKSTTDENTAITPCSDLRNMLAKSAFRLTKWSSNSQKFPLQFLKRKEHKGFQNLDLDEDNLLMERALGASCVPNQISSSSRSRSTTH